MYISSLEITNFRNFKNTKFHFTQGVNTLIGENSSGKSNALYAIRLLLDETLPLSASKFLESDFNQALGDWKGHWIVLKMTFKDLDQSEAANFVAHYTEDPRSEESKGTYAMYFRPNKSTRKHLFELSKAEDETALSTFLNKITLNDYETVYSCRVDADFNNKIMYKELVGDFENNIFPDPEQEDNTLLGTISPHITLIKKEVSCTFVKALRNVIAELRQRKGSPLLQLLRGTAKEIQVDEAGDIIKKVEDLNERIGDLKEVETLTAQIKESLTQTLGYTYSPEVSIKSELPNEIETLMHSLTLWVGDNKDSNQGKLDDLSLGGANLIYITLKLLEYEFYQEQEEKAAHFILIEEPEAHIHTHVQKTLFDKYKLQNTQVIITTHSTHISSASRIESVNVLVKDLAKTKVCHPSKGLDSNSCKRIERYLDATRSTILFAKGVILVEGDAELILIPILFKEVFGLSLDELGISVINMSSTVFKHVADLFNEERIHRKCSIVTDLDAAFVQLPSERGQDNSEQRKMRDSQEDGLGRKTELDGKYHNNPWVNAYYAQHTFEVDFVFEGNQDEIKETLNLIYNRQASIQASLEILESEDEEKIGKETLRLAKKEGKGWFALLLSEKITPETFIPSYILDAIAFASSHISEKHLEAMAKYRLKQVYDEELEHDLIDDCDLNNMNLNELKPLLESYNLENEYDDLSYFMSIL